MFNVEAYMAEMDRDYDYYLFWAEEIFDQVWDRVCTAKNVSICQIRTAQFLMDQGQQTNYQEDGYILGQIIFESVKQELKQVDCIQ